MVALVFEKERSRRERFEQDLHEEGYTVYATDNLRIAVDLARHRRPDLVLLSAEPCVSRRDDAEFHLLKVCPSLTVLYT